MVKRNSTRALVCVRASSSGDSAGSSNLVECTRDLIEIAARVGFVHEAVLTAIHALNSACLELDSETSACLSRQARDAVAQPLAELAAHVRVLQQFLEQQPPSETTGLTISIH
jgi:hypothetical protein